MTEQLPAPPISEDVDLRDMEWMPLDVVRLRDSDTVTETTGDEFKAAVLLWAASWHQQPPGSLPDNDKVLAKLAGFGTVVRAWTKVKRGALRGWTHCNDGRLYHAVIIGKARAAWKSKLEFAYGRECDRLRKANKARRDRREPELLLPSFDDWWLLRKSAGIPPETPELSAGKLPSSGRKHPDIPPETALKGEVRDISLTVTSQGGKSGRDPGDNSPPVDRNGREIKAPPGWRKDPNAAGRYGEALGVPPHRGERLEQLVERIDAALALRKAQRHAH